MKTISIKKLSTKLQQYILKEVAGAKSMNYEGDSMSKQKVTLEMFFNEFMKFKEEVSQRLDVLESKMDLLFSLPTIKKEIKELDS